MLLKKTLLNKLKNKVRSFVIHRMCRVYSVNSKKLVSRVSKAQLPVPDSSDLHGKVVHLFHDDTLKSFFRRLCFSPDGQLLIVPSGIIENPNSEKHSNAAFIFTRRMFNR
jgi:chromatin assembly factor 1 subunit B